MRRPSFLVILAYLWWGVSAIFWTELASVPAVHQLGWRITMGIAVLGLLWLIRRQFPFRNLSRRHVLYGVAGSIMISTNWAVFLWALANERAVEASLGYFLMPLFSVALGVVVLGESLRNLQRIAIVLATIGIGWILIRQGGLPWVALILGVSFALYGLVRKQGPWGAIDGLTVEMGIVAPVAIASLIVASQQAEAVSGDGTLWTWFLILCTGVATVVPLVLFASAAREVSLTVVGLLAYLNPISQFLVGWLYLGESIGTDRLVGFLFTWAALMLVVLDELVRPKVSIAG